MTDNADVIALVPAGGGGTRMGAGTKKQFRDLAGTPIVIHTLRRLVASNRVAEIVVAAAAADVAAAERLVGDYGFEKPVHVVTGGDTRQASVAAALAAAPTGFDLILIHDAVRPFVTVDMIAAVVEAAAAAGAAAVAIPVKDTLKRVDNGYLAGHVDREGVVRVQTPQVFRRRLLEEALARATADRFVGGDESSLVERIGHPVRVVAGDETNIKITTLDDLALARFIFDARV
jgi:2-C-methyl-D-erythritol 4-phosphate cytidylyltransferase